MVDSQSKNLGFYDEVAHLELQDEVRKLINDLPCSCTYHVKAEFKSIVCQCVLLFHRPMSKLKFEVVNK